jgi:hypothetical protein
VGRNGSEGRCRRAAGGCNGDGNIQVTEHILDGGDRTGIR